MALDTNKIRLKLVRGSYLHLFVARAMNEGDKPKFSASLILDKKKHAAEIKMLERAIDQVAREKWKDKIPKTLKRCLRDGEEHEGKDGYGEGVMFISASSDKRVPVVGKDLEPITAEDDILYSGCFINVTIRLWAQDNQYGKRVNAALRAVQFAKDGDRFGEAPVDPEDEFEAIEDDEEEEEEEEEETPAQRKKRLAKEKAKRDARRGGDVL